ncbi:hypothetical protein FALCPG4_012197 [Fusarium falciforme]
MFHLIEGIDLIREHLWRDAALEGDRGPSFITATLDETASQLIVFFSKTSSEAHQVFMKSRDGRTYQGIQAYLTAVGCHIVLGEIATLSSVISPQSKPPS